MHSTRHQDWNTLIYLWTITTTMASTRYLSLFLLQCNSNWGSRRSFDEKYGKDIYWSGVIDDETYKHDMLCWNMFLQSMYIGLYQCEALLKKGVQWTRVRHKQSAETRYTFIVWNIHSLNVIHSLYDIYWCFVCRHRRIAYI